MKYILDICITYIFQRVCKYVYLLHINVYFYVRTYLFINKYIYSVFYRVYKVKTCVRY